MGCDVLIEHFRGYSSWIRKALPNLDKEYFLASGSGSAELELAMSPNSLKVGFWELKNTPAHLLFFKLGAYSSLNVMSFVF
jgi:hypothetical protein